MTASAQGLCDFIDASPSPFHVCATVADRLRAAGLTELHEGDGWPSAASGESGSEGKFFTVRAGSLVAWQTTELSLPFRIIGAHTDSPNLRVKQHPDRFVAGWQVVALAALRRRVAELVARPRPRHQWAAVGAGRERHRRPVGAHRRADPAGAATGDPPGRRPQGGLAGPAAARQRGVGRRQRDAVVSELCRRPRRGRRGRRPRR